MSEELETNSELDERIRNWAEGMGSTPSVRIEVYRVSPKTWQGRKTDGKLGSFDELPDWEDIRAEYGGGKFRLTIKRPDSRGRMVYAGCRTVAIAGVPFIPSDAPIAFEKGERDKAVREIAMATAEKLFARRVCELEQAVRLLRNTQ